MSNNNSGVNERLIFGEKGFNIYSGGESSSDELFSVIQVVEDAIISISSASNSASIVDLSLSAGTPIYGIFKGLTVVSGKVIAYKR